MVNLYRYVVAANCGVWSAYGPLGGQWQSLHAGEAGAAALAIINSTANLGGMLGPILLGHFPNTIDGLSVLAALLLASAGMVAAYPSPAAEGGIGYGLGRGRDVLDEVEDEEEGKALVRRGEERSS
jgi:hypothetical protein